MSSHSPQRMSSRLSRVASFARQDANPSTSFRSNIKVLLRVRPLSEREEGDSTSRSSVIQVVDSESVIFDPSDENEFPDHFSKKRQPKNLQFTFDQVFGPDEPTFEIYEHSIQELIGNLLQGYNCTVFAYGGTGAGKTFTMLGSQECPGVTALLVEELYNAVEQDSAEVVCSYLEIYNEKVHDLLEDSYPPRPLQLREDGPTVVVGDLSWFRPSTAQELMSILQNGNSRRTQHPTDANGESSRSHAVFQVALEMRNSYGETHCAKLCLVDLAGSDRSSTATDFKRKVEGANINKSLLALGSCIDALADGLRHVPFRNSKLTRLLKNSLDGNCRTVMIANVSPSIVVYDDTYSTLKYAVRVKKIENTVRRNVISTKSASVEVVKELDAAREQMRLLEEEIAALRAENLDLKEAAREHVCVVPEKSAVGRRKSDRKISPLIAVARKISHAPKVRDETPEPSPNSRSTPRNLQKQQNKPSTDSHHVPYFSKWFDGSDLRNDADWKERYIKWLTLLVCCISLTLLIISISTQQWVVSGAERKFNPENSTQGQVKLGIFTGSRSFNFGSGWENKSYSVKELVHLDDKYDFGLNQDIYHGSVTGLCISLALAISAVVVSGLNVLLSTSAYKVLRIRTIFIITLLGIAFDLLAVTLWSVAFFKSFRYNVLPQEDLDMQWTSTEKASFGFSYWLAISAALLRIITTIALLFTTRKQIFSCFCSPQPAKMEDGANNSA